MFLHERRYKDNPRLMQELLPHPSHISDQWQKTEAKPLQNKKTPAGSNCIRYPENLTQQKPSN